MALPPRNIDPLTGQPAMSSADPLGIGQPPPRPVRDMGTINVDLSQPEPVQDVGTLDVASGTMTPPGQLTPQQEAAAQKFAQQQANMAADQAMQQKYGSNLVGAAQVDLAKAGRALDQGTADLEKSRQMGQQTAQSVRDLAAERAALETPMYDKYAAELEAEQLKYQAQRDRVQRAVDQNTRELDSAVSEFSATKITSWYDQADTGTKIFAVLATAFQSAAQAMQGQFGGQTAMERIINADMERQKLQIQLQERKISAKQTMLGQLRNQLGDMDSAMVAFQNIASNSIKAQAQSIASKLGTKEAEVTAQKIVQEQDEKIAQRKSALQAQKSQLFTTKAQMEENTALQMEAQRIKEMLGLAKIQGKQAATLADFEGSERMDAVEKRRLSRVIGYAKSNVDTLDSVEALVASGFKGMKPVEAVKTLKALALVHGLNFNMAKGLTRFNQKEFEELEDGVASLGSKVEAFTGGELPFGVRKGILNTIRILRADLKNNVYNLATAWEGVKPRANSVFNLNKDDEALLKSVPAQMGAAPESAKHWATIEAADSAKDNTKTDDDEEE